MQKQHKQFESLFFLPKQGSPDDKWLMQKAKIIVLRCSASYDFILKYLFQFSYTLYVDPLNLSFKLNSNLCMSWSAAWDDNSSCQS